MVICILYHLMDDLYVWSDDCALRENLLGKAIRFRTRKYFFIFLSQTANLWFLYIDSIN